MIHFVCVYVREGSKVTKIMKEEKSGRGGEDEKEGRRKVTSTISHD